MSDDALTFLQGDSQGRKRDLIARYYYEVAQGDPRSAPVSFAVLLDACAEQFAKTPKELREANEYFRLILGEAREFERKMLERIQNDNASVIAAFKDETRRAREAWRETINQAEYVRERAAQVAHDMEDVVTSAKRIADDFGTLKGDLKLQEESAKTIVEGVESIKVIHLDIQALVTHLAKKAGFNWMTIGFLTGIIFDEIAIHVQAPSWAIVLAFALGAGWLQWLFRNSRNFVKKKVEMIKLTNPKK
jgi:hypothetical protein